MNVLDLFSGIGGFSLGLERAGMKTVAFCEIDSFCRQVLKKNFSNVPQYEDICDLSADRLKTDGISVDVICGGFPCQDISVANKHGKGLDGERSGLWSEYKRLISEIRPKYALIENVTNLLTRGFGTLLCDLAEIGYNAEWHCISASEIGACHKRERLWIVAYPNSKRGCGVDKIRKEKRAILDIKGIEWGSCLPPNIFFTMDRKFSNPSSGFTRNDDGLSAGVERLRAIGNAVVPQIAEMLGNAIMESENEYHG